jgi:hypothetical protein
LERLSIPRLCLNWKEFALFLSLEIPRDLSGKHLGNQSLKRLGMISILFTIRDHIESKLVP